MKAMKALKQRILIVDPCEQIRRDLRAFLEKCGAYEVVGEATTPSEVINLAPAACPEIVLVDVEMLKGDGLRILRFLRHCLPQTALVVVTHSNEDEYWAAGKSAGAVAMISKRRLFESLIPTLDEARNATSKALRRDDSEKVGARPGERGHGFINGLSAVAPGIWWTPSTWREWLAGMLAFGFALIRGVPVHSSPSANHWGYVQAAMLFLILDLGVAHANGAFYQMGTAATGMVLVTLLVLIRAQFRQIRRLSLAKRASGNGRALK